MTQNDWSRLFIHLKLRDTKNSFTQLQISQIHSGVRRAYFFPILFFILVKAKGVNVVQMS